MRKEYKQILTEAKKLGASYEITASEMLSNPDVAAYAMDILAKSDNEDVVPWIIGKQGINTHKKSEGKRSVRTDKQTIKKAYLFREQCKRNAKDDTGIYLDFWKDLLEILDVYFIKVSMDMYEQDRNIVKVINQLRLEKAEQELEKAEQELDKEESE